MGMHAQVGDLLEQQAPRRAPAPEQPAAGAAPQGNGAEAAGEALPNGDAAAAHAPSADDMETDAGAAAAAAVSVSLTPEEERYMERYDRLKGIISGATSIGLYLEFLYSHNHADLQVWALQLAAHKQSATIKSESLSLCQPDIYVLTSTTCTLPLKGLSASTCSFFLERQ